MSGLNKSHKHYFKGSHLLCPPATKNEGQEEVKKNVADSSLSSLERKKKFQKYHFKVIYPIYSIS